ncbi:MAG TPA: inositol-3-phosphate synthase [Gaiellaceae bacterium]
MARDRSDVLVRMPAELKRRLAREVEARGSNLNDVAVEILASRFAVPFQGSGRRGGRASGRGDVLLRMPAELKTKLARRASERKRSVTQLIVETLSERLDSTRKESMASKNGSTNGRPGSDERVRVAIIGVGNCANSLLQGVNYYKDADPDQFVPGLMHVDVGGYHIRDIEFTAAFDVTTDKVGKDLADAIWAHPNDTYKFADVPKTGVKVSRGMTHDGIGKYLSEVVEKAPGETDDVVGILKETGTDVVVNYLPVGSEEATKWYTEQILSAGCAMVNCMPVFIAREAYWQRRFEQAGVPIIGDDIKSQVGATITHRVLTSLFRERGVRLDKTMQLNVGGNSDFLNMLERDRLESKKISKTNAVTSMLDYDIGAQNVHVGPSDYVPWLTDRKWAYIRMEGSAFGDVPLNVELKLEVWDSPNSAGIVIDAVRLGKLALNNGISGALEGPSAYLMKSPPKQIVDDDARELVEDFIKKNARARTKQAATAS